MNRIVALLALLAASAATARGASIVPFTEPGPTGPTPSGSRPGLLRLVPSGGEEVLAVLMGRSALVARVDGEAQPIDSIPLTFADDSQRASAAATSAGWLVVGQDVRLLRRDGSFLPRTRPASLGQTDGAVSRNDRVCVLANAHVDVYDAVGTVIASTPVAPTKFRTVIAEPNAFLVITADRPGNDGPYTIEGRRFDLDGHELGRFPLGTVFGVGALAAAFDGTRDLVFWTEGVTVHAATIAPGASDAAALSSPVGDAGIGVVTLALSSVAGSTWLAWKTANDAYAVPLTNGIAAQPPLRVPAVGVGELAIAAIPDGAIAGWIAADGQSRVAKLTPAAAGPPVLISRATAAQGPAVLATDGEAIMALYREGENAYAMARRADGSTTAPVHLSPDGKVGLGLALAYGADAYLAVWMDENEQDSSVAGRIVARRIARDGSPLDGAPFVLAAADSTSYTYGLSVAWDGTRWLVVYISQSRRTYATALEGVRIAGDGTRLDAQPLALAAAAGDVARCDVAFAGVQFVVVYLDAAESVNAAVVDGATGMVTNRVELATEANLFTPLRVVASPTTLLVTWEGARAIHHMRILSTPAFGLKLPAATRRRASGRPSFPSSWQMHSESAGPLVFDGTNFVQFFVQYASTAGYSVARTVLSPAGQVLVEHEPEEGLADVPFPLSAAAAHGVVALAAEGKTSGPPYGATTRLFWVVP